MRPPILDWDLRSFIQFSASNDLIPVLLKEEKMPGPTWKRAHPSLSTKDSQAQPRWSPRHHVTNKNVGQ